MLILLQNWEDVTLWIDIRGHFHSWHHSFCGFKNDYPRPGCNESSGSAPCTKLGAHGFSLDARHWYISAVALYNASTEYIDGEVLTFRARERPHAVLDRQGHVTHLSNGVGAPNPTSTGCRAGNVGCSNFDHSFSLIQPVVAV